MYHPFYYNARKHVSRIDLIWLGFHLNRNGFSLSLFSKAVTAVSHISQSIADIMWSCCYRYFTAVSKKDLSEKPLLWNLLDFPPPWFTQMRKPNSCVYLNALIPALYAGPSIRPCNRMGAQGQEAESMHTYTHTLLSPPCKCYRSHSMCSKWFCVQFCVCVSFCT